MNLKKFNEVIQEFLEEEQRLTRSKGMEYSTDEQRLLNFTQVGDIQGLRPSQICMTYILKHLMALSHQVNESTVKWCWKTPEGDEGAKQRIADMRIYFMLLAGCILHEIENGHHIVYPDPDKPETEPDSAIRPYRPVPYRTKMKGEK